MIVIGYTGTFFAKLIKAAISRQREFLADASAVQYTRNPEGIAGALKKIGGYDAGSYIAHPNASQVSHLFFGEGINALASMFATHPPLEERIKAIDKHWDGEFISIDANSVAIEKPEIDPRYVNIINGEVHYTPPTAATTVVAAASVAAALDSIGAPQPEHLDEAKQRLANIPEDLQKLAREPQSACAIIHCLLMDRNTQEDAQNFPTISAKTINSIKQLPYALRLPLLDICLPSLKLLSTAQREHFLQAVMVQIQADQKISLFEWSLYRILRHSLDAKKQPSGSLTLSATNNSCRTVLSALSLATHTEIAAQLRFTQAWEQLGLPAAACDTQALSDISALDQAVQQLRRLQVLAKPRLLKACCAAIANDDQQYSAEAIELLRAVADTLDTPIPPIATQQTIAA